MEYPASHAVIRHIEELSLNAWPCLETAFYDGWVLRFAAGYTRRANSVNPLYPSSLDPVQKLGYCQRAYRDRGLPAVFKLTPASEDLDAFLGEHGYGREAPTSVQIVGLSEVPQPRRDGVELLEQPNRAWFAAYCALNRDVRRHFLTMTQMLERLAVPACFVSFKQDGETVALGMAVAERGYVGLFDIVTRQTVRNQGIGRDVVLHLLQWGKRQGAEHAYLQVMRDNAPALHLYQKLGFRELYGYWFRVRASGTGRRRPLS